MDKILSALVQSNYFDLDIMNTLSLQSFYSIVFSLLLSVCVGVGVTSQVVLVVENLPANAGARDTSSILGSGTTPGGGRGNPLQYSCLENLMDRGAWQAMYGQ